MRSLLNLIQKKEKYKCLSVCAHERYQSDMSDINCDFYLYKKSPHIKTWNEQFAPLPSNHFLLPELYFPIGLDFDFVLSQHRFGCYQELAPIAQKLQIPLVTLEHTMPMVDWPRHHFEKVKQMLGHVNLYISKFSMEKWEDPKGIVIPHCINSEIFCPGTPERNNQILTVVNDYPGRGQILGFDQYLKVTDGLPVLRVGDSPGFSKAASGLEELISFYQKSSIFLNTSIFSPIPKSLLEAMSCGCAVISSNNCAIPEYIEHGINGLLANSDEEMRMYLEKCLKDKDLCEFLGENARKTILEKCNKSKYTSTWNKIIEGIIESQLRIKNES